MLSKTTKNSGHSLENVYKHFMASISKVGAENVSEFLELLSLEDHAKLDVLVLKKLCAEHFLISVDSITEDLSHFHSQIRSICFYILHKEGMSVRVIGHHFDRKENAVHKQIASLSHMLEKPSTSSKVIVTAYMKISENFNKFKSAKERQAPSLQSLKTKEELSQIIRSKVKDQMTKLSLSQADLAHQSGLSKAFINELLSGKYSSLSAHTLHLLEHALQIKLT